MEDKTSNMTKQIAEPLKTFVIVLLLACALFLAGKTGVFNEFFRSVPVFVKAENWLSSIGQKSPVLTDPRKILREAARPVSIVLTGNDSLHYGVKNDGAALSALYDKLSNTLGEALGSASVPVEISRVQWNSALKSEGIYFDFLNEIPLSIIVRWLGLEMINENQHIARRICIASSDKENIDVYYINEDGRFYKCRTAAVLSTITPLFKAYMQQSINYAFELDDDYDKLDPYTLLFSNPPDKFRIEVENRLDSDEVRDSVLTAFGINPSSNATYIKSGGTIAYVYGSQTSLDIYTNGLISYNTDAENSLFPLSFAGSKPDSGELIEGARAVVDLLLQNSTGDEDIFFTDIIQISDQAYKVTFDYFINGSEIVNKDHAAVVTIENGSITGVDVYMRSYNLTNEKATIYPELTAVATIRRYPGSELCLVYPDSSNGLIDPIWIAHVN